LDRLEGVDSVYTGPTLCGAGFDQPEPLSSIDCPLREVTGHLAIHKQAPIYQSLFRRSPVKIHVGFVTSFQFFLITKFKTNWKFEFSILQHEATNVCWDMEPFFIPLHPLIPLARFSHVQLLGYQMLAIDNGME
jgi:hypothetical protein